MKQNTSLLQSNNPLPRVEPLNPNRVFGFIFIISVIGVGIVLGLNWKRLGKPEWVQKTVIVSILMPVASVGIALIWLLQTLDLGSVEISVLSLAAGINLGYAYALARLQNGAYKKWKSEGLEAMLAHEYNINEAIRFGAIAAGVITILIFWTLAKMT